MAVESATKIHELVPSSPAGSDPVAEGAGHHRVTKAAVKGSFPNFGTGGDSGAVTLTADTINGLPASIATKAASDHLHTGVYSPVAHLHDGVYSPVDHLHTGVYSPVAHNHAGVYEPVLNTDQKRKITISASDPDPSSGVNGDIWLKV